MWSKNIADENSIIMVILNLSIFLFVSIIDFFLLTTMTITHTMIITRTPHTTPTSIPPTHETPLVDVLLLTMGEQVELSVHGVQDWDIVAEVPVVVMVTLDIVLVVIFEWFMSVYTNKINNHLGQKAMHTHVLYTHLLD